MTELPPLPDPDMGHQKAPDDCEWETSYSAEAMHAYAAEAVRVALEDVAADLAQAVCDDCENGVQWLNLAASAKFSKDYPHLRAAITALAKDRT